MTVKDFLTKQITDTSVKLDELLRETPINIADIHRYSGILLGQQISLNVLNDETNKKKSKRATA